MGNAWTKRRANFGRPQVCHPPLPPAVPASSFTCQLDPPTGVLLVGDMGTLTLYGFDGDVAQGVILGVDWISPGITFLTNPDLPNDQPTVYEIEAGFTPGTYRIIATINSPDGHACIAFTDVIIEEMA